VYGISQNPDTKDYIIVLLSNYCEECGKEYTDIISKWCELCQINNFKKIFTNWTSGNKKVDDFIQKMQQRIYDYNNTIFEWIPYNQFDNIKEISKDVFLQSLQQYGGMAH